MMGEIDSWLMNENEKCDPKTGRRVCQWEMVEGDGELWRLWKLWKL